MPDEPEFGGDPACWSHLFDGERSGVETVDLVELSANAAGKGPIWSMQSTDLNVNLIRLNLADNIADHVNCECDVLIVGVSGSGLVIINDLGHPIQPGTLILIEQGANRAITPQETPFTYLTCHKRRPPLMPKPVGTER